MGKVKVFYAGKFSNDTNVPAGLRGRKIFYNPATERYDISGMSKQMYCSVEQFNDYEKLGLIISPTDKRKKHDDKQSLLVNGEPDWSYRVHTQDGYHKIYKERPVAPEDDAEYFVPEDFKAHADEEKRKDWQMRKANDFKKALESESQDVEPIKLDPISEEQWEHIYDGIADIRNAFTPNDYY